jgi:hypothetical protein
VVSAFESNRASNTSRYVPIAVMAVLGAMVLLVSAAEEPYHFDELKQVRIYHLPMDEVLEASSLLEQPPLDVVLNSIAQKTLLGVGDVRQRFLSVVFGIGNIVLIALLSMRAKFTSVGTVLAMGVMALTPLAVGLTAYARPYALPLFLSLGFLWLSDVWLKDGRRWCLALMVVVALLLPWSRAVEPAILLVLTAVAAMVFWVRRKDPARSLVLLSVSAVGIAGSVVVTLLLSEELSDRTAFGTDLLSRIGRIVMDVPPTIPMVFPYWPILVGLALVGFFHRPTRTLLKPLWWWWVLVATSLGFVAAFFVATPASQPFAARYMFTMIPTAAVLTGAVVSGVVSSNAPRVFKYTTVGLASVAVLWGAAGTWHELTTHSRADWKAASRVLMEDLPEGTMIIYDEVRGVRQSKRAFMGSLRYTDGRLFPLSLQIIEDPSLIDPGSNTAIVLYRREEVEAPGWIPIRVDDFVTVYVPTSPREGLEGAASAAEEFADALGPKLGAALNLTAASLWQRAGENARTAELVSEVLADESLRDLTERWIEGSALKEYAQTSD